MTVRSWDDHDSTLIMAYKPKSVKIISNFNTVLQTTGCCDNYVISAWPLWCLQLKVSPFLRPLQKKKMAPQPTLQMLLLKDPQYHISC